MSGKEILIDSNIAIYLLKGNDNLSHSLQNTHVHISLITELEIIGYPKLTENDFELIQEFLQSTSILPISEEIKFHYRKYRLQFGLKLSDAIIAASAFVHNMPLFTADKGFQRVKDVQVFLFRP